MSLPRLPFDEAPSFSHSAVAPRSNGNFGYANSNKPSSNVTWANQSNSNAMWATTKPFGPNLKIGHASPFVKNVEFGLAKFGPYGHKESRASAMIGPHGNKGNGKHPMLGPYDHVEHGPHMATKACLT